jgi:hypothetical protein
MHHFFRFLAYFLRHIDDSLDDDRWPTFWHNLPIMTGINLVHFWILINPSSNLPISSDETTLRINNNFPHDSPYLLKPN